MNKTAALIALTLAAGAAQAGDIDTAVNAAMFATSIKTRAEVVAEVVKARSAGQPVVAALVQIDMVDERGAERRLAAAMNGEDSGSFYLAQVAPKKVVKR